MTFIKVHILLFLLPIILTIKTSLSYERPPARKSIFLSLSQELDSSSPQQVHISMVGEDKMRISWITEDSGTPATVKYGTSPGSYPFSSNGNTTKYRYILYESGEIHNVVIGPLKPNTVYYYICGPFSSPEFNFKTPPAGFPIKFAVVGDLGQTDWTTSTLDHISKSNYDVMLLPGDLSYADTLQPRWDSFGRLVEPLASQRPWMVTQGNHEVEKIPVLHSQSFTSYNARWLMPFEQSGSTSNLYYSFEVIGLHIIMLGSYTDFEPESAQYNWLKNDLNEVDRKKTPWLVVLVHAPWYNSNNAHQGEYESYGMKSSMEDLLFKARVDIVFAGHVHAYERFTRVYNDKANNCGPIYITIGDGGNREGLASKYKDPKPEISNFREASFGHGELDVVNATHAQWSWHRNDDDEAVVADTIWITNPSCKL
ncbi:probable purple acid phosphatase 20 [Solanum dulcamara]|uniref:probable purple acid phosphatase 20 n=1 Tax=Solanum dulcamara TaxID=45834 RepID=UPI00248558F0|nr:probable purple acid phosphatase 20 [Solanum dulcamara]